MKKEKRPIEAEDCLKCSGKGELKVWNGSIHDPKDPEIIKCETCKGRGWVVYAKNPH